MTHQPLERVVAIVPVKGLPDSKSRLGAAVHDSARARLVVATLRLVLAALQAPAIVARMVVSPDRDILEAARSAGAVGLPQVGGKLDPLNGALEQARDFALRRRPRAVLVVLGDLPLLTQADIEGMLELAREEPVAVIAPDRHGTGTNALLLRPPDALLFSFGAASCQRHLTAARQRDLVATRYYSPGLAFDLDTPADLNELVTHRPDLAWALTHSDAPRESPV